MAVHSERFASIAPALLWARLPLQGADDLVGPARDARPARRGRLCTRTLTELSCSTYPGLMSRVENASQVPPKSVGYPSPIQPTRRCSRTVQGTAARAPDSRRDRRPRGWWGGGPMPPPHTPRVVPAPKRRPRSPRGGARAAGTLSSTSLLSTPRCGHALDAPPRIGAAGVVRPGRPRTGWDEPPPRRRAPAGRFVVVRRALRRFAGRERRSREVDLRPLRCGELRGRWTGGGVTAGPARGGSLALTTPRRPPCEPARARPRAPRRSS